MNLDAITCLPNQKTRQQLSRTVSQCERQSDKHPCRVAVDFTLALLLTLVCTNPVWAVDTYWTTGTGDWFTAGNWDTGDVPTASDNTYIDNNGTAQVQSSDAVTDYFYIGHSNGNQGNLEINNGGTVNSSHFSYLGYLAGSQGNVTISGADSSMTNNYGIIIGDAGSGVLYITDGGSLTNTYSYSYIGNKTDSQGSVTVTGTNSSWIYSGNLYVGQEGTGTLHIDNSGTVSGGAAYLGGATGGEGSATVTGTNSTWEPDGLQIGYFGTGTLNITDGGEVTNTDSAAIAVAGGQGTVTVAGSGSRWTNLELAIGASGDGTLNIFDGGEVNSSYSTIGSNPDSIGSVIVSGPDSNWTISSNFKIGGSGTGTLRIENGGTVTNNDDATIANFYDSTGNVAVKGPGSTWINTAALVVGEHGNGTLNIFDGGKVTSTYGIIGRRYDGKGNVTVDGTGSNWTTSSNLIVGRDNTGRLDIINGGTVTSTYDSYIGYFGTGDVIVSATDSSWANSGAIYIGYDDTGTLSIADSGTVTTDGGAGTVTIASSSWSNGTLNIGAASGDPATAPGTLNAGQVAFGDGTGSLVFNHTDTDYYFDPAISGNGAIDVISGTTNLTADLSGFTGNANITGGTLRMNNLFGGNIAVSFGGTLAPGNSIGILNVAGDVDFSAGGIYQVEVNADGNSDKIIASGTATLSGGAVQVIPDAGTYQFSTDYTILTADTINGSFDSVSSTLAFLDPTLSYDANNVYLNLTRTDDIDFSTVASTPNQQTISNVLDTIFTSDPKGDMLPVFNDLSILTAEGARQAYDYLSGVQHAGAQSLLIGHNLQFSTRLSARTRRLAARPGITANRTRGFAPIQVAYNGDLGGLQLASNDSTTGDLLDDTGSGWWLSPEGGIGDIEDTANASGLDYSYYGLYGGRDTWLDNHRLVGIALGLSHTDADPEAGTAQHDSLELAFYGRWQIGDGYLNGSFSAGYHQTDSARQVTTGTASSEYDSQSIVLALEAGRAMYEKENITLSPFAGVDYAHLNREAFSETGAGPANLNVDSETLESLRSRLGLRLETSRTSDENRDPEWDIELAWAHEFRDTNARLVAGFEGAPASTFIVNGPQLDHNRAQLGVGITTPLGKSSQLRIGYNGEMASSDTRHSIHARYRMQW